MEEGQVVELRSSGLPPGPSVTQKPEQEDLVEN